MNAPLSKSVAVALLLAVMGSGAAYGADPAPAGAVISREEYEKLQKDNESLKKDNTELKQGFSEMRKELDEIKQAKGGGGGADPKEVAELRTEVASLRKSQEEKNKQAEEDTEYLTKLVKEVKDQAKANATGTTQLLITGDASVGFDAHRHQDSTFQAGVAPRFLWKMSDQMYFDAALDIGIGRDDAGNNTTSVDLTIATFNYVVCDYLTIGGGLFVVPFAAYHHNFDPAWINKLPDDPLVFSDGGLAPGSALGIFATGGYRFNNGMKINYAIYLDNGPDLNGSDGTISFDNFTDLNNNKAVGGRVGFLPVPEFEVGYSMECGEASADALGHHVNAMLWALDANYSKEFDWISGRVTAHAEGVWSHVGRTTIDTDAANGGPFNFANNRNGGYMMLAYRPTQASIKLLRNFEFVERYDRMDAPNGAPGTAHEQRWTHGLDYWLDSRAVVKFAYECDNIAGGSGSSAYLFQVGMGF